MLRKSNIVLLFLFFLVSCGDNYLQKQTGIKVCFKTDKLMFPLSWLNNEIKPHAKSLPLNLRPEAKRMIIKAFEKYPKEILYKNLEKVYILEELNFYGVDYGGTNTNDIVYVVYYDYITDFIEKTFHHEFGAVLMYNYNFDTTAYKLMIADNVEYGNGGIVALLNDESSTDFDYELIESGFLSEYGSSCVEEDFCSVCEQLFKPEAEFWYVYDTYPVMQKKIKYIIDFYHSIDTSFNERYFRSFNDSLVSNYITAN